MAEYINKRRLMDEFYGALKVPVKDKDDKMGWFAMSADYVYDITNSLPTIEIVHCKECAYEDCGMCSHVDHEWENHEADHFCADGELPNCKYYHNNCECWAQKYAPPCYHNGINTECKIYNRAKGDEHNDTT